MTVKGGTSQACAACKYQRRKCSGDCPLAPYFPPDQPKLFQNAHRLFGVSNIIKILNKIEPTQKTEAMRSIIYEANVRDRYPAHGCVGLINELVYQIQHAQMELDAVNAQLVIYRTHLFSSPSSSSSADKYLPFDVPSTTTTVIADNSHNNNNNDDRWVIADNSDNNNNNDDRLVIADNSDNNNNDDRWVIADNSDDNNNNDDRWVIADNSDRWVIANNSDDNNNNDDRWVIADNSDRWVIADNSDNNNNDDEKIEAFCDYIFYHNNSKNCKAFWTHNLYHNSSNDDKKIEACWSDDKNIEDNGSTIYMDDEISPYQIDEYRVHESRLESLIKNKNTMRLSMKNELKAAAGSFNLTRCEFIEHHEFIG